MPYKDPEKAQECRLRWKRNNPEKARASALRWYYSNKDRYKSRPQTASRKVYMDDYNLRYTYGISREKYNQLLTDQQNKCAVCFRAEEVIWRGRPRALSIDHDHNTRKIRGLLCSRCNQALGLLKENSTVIRQLANYIELHNAEMVESTSGEVLSSTNTNGIFEGEERTNLPSM